MNTGTDPWDVYWNGTRENAAHQQGGPQEAVLEAFWSELFKSQTGPQGRSDERLQLLDIACGNGAVSGFALASGGNFEQFACDFSHSAMAQLGRRHGGVTPVQADAAHLPFASQCFDLVCSQFGLEYAGASAFAEAGRVIAPQGTLATVVHLHDGAIYQECAGNLQAAQGILGTAVLDLAEGAFSAGFDLNEGVGDVAAFKAAEREFTPTVRALESVIKRFGAGAAGGLAQQIYRDIAQMYRRMSAYAREDVLGWVVGMRAELDAYCGRMSTMMAAALTTAQRDSVIAELANGGLGLIENRTMNMDASKVPGAVVMVWQRG
ncbi:MAG: class I SAM-dependent methyltransferase [Pseudomonadales bacterium]